MKLTAEQRRVREKYTCITSRGYVGLTIGVQQFSLHLSQGKWENEFYRNQLAIALTALIDAERKPAIVKPEPGCKCCVHCDKNEWCMMSLERFDFVPERDCVCSFYNHWAWDGSTEVKK